MTRLAYLILAHKNPRQLADLVATVAGPEVGVFVHLDARADRGAFETALADAGATPELLLHRVRVVYSSWRMIEATLPLVRAAYEAGYGYFVLLGGQDHPVRPPAAVRQRLLDEGGVGYIRHEPIPTPSLALDGIPRVRYRSFVVGDRNETLYPFTGHGRRLSLRGKVLNAVLWLRALGRVERDFPLGMRPYYCSQWWNLPRDAVGRMLAFIDEHPEYARWHEEALHPEEMFFQTILLNDPEWSDRIVNDDLRHIGWVEGEKHPRMLEVGDVPDILDSDALFARKVTREAGAALRASWRKDG